MNCERLKQPAQPARVYIRSSEYKLQLPVQCFYGIPECEEWEEVGSGSYAFWGALFLLLVCPIQL